MRLAFWRKANPEEQQKIRDVAVASTSSSGIRAALARLVAAEPNWRDMESALLSADVGLATARAVLETARTNRDGDAAASLRAALVDVLREADTTDRTESTIVLLVGVNGSGKTTSAAKLAARARASGASPLLVAADTFRAAAVDQLRILARREAVEIVEGRPGGDPAAAIHDGLSAAAARGLRPVVVDTAGRMQNRSALMDELSKIRRVIARLAPEATVEVLLVVDATAGQNGLAQARGFDAAAGVDGVILTKMDAGARGGIAVAIRRELGLPIRWLGVGEGSADLVPFDAEAFVDGLLRLDSER